MYKTNDACIIEIGMNYLVTAFDFLSNVQSSFPTMSTFTRGRPPSNWATGNRVPGCLVLSCRAHTGLCVCGKLKFELFLMQPRFILARKDIGSGPSPLPLHPIGHDPPLAFLSSSPCENFKSP